MANFKENKFLNLFRKKKKDNSQLLLIIIFSRQFIPQLHQFHPHSPYLAF